MDVHCSINEQQSQDAPETEPQEESGWMVTMNLLAPEMQLGLHHMAAALTREARERFEATHD